MVKYSRGQVFNLRSRGLAVQISTRKIDKTCMTILIDFFCCFLLITHGKRESMEHVYLQ